MSKYDNIYEKLTDVEKEFKDLLIRELEMLSRGGYSSYLNVRSSKYHVGKKSKNSNTIYMEKLEKNIVQLREKIFGNTESGILQMVEELAEVYQNSYKLPEGGIQSAAKNILHELQTTKDDNYQSVKGILGQITVPENYPIRDIIVKARKNRFYPMSSREISDLLDKLKITDSKGNRLAIELRNPPTGSLDFPLAQLIPHRRIIINSLPDSFNKELSKGFFISAIKLIEKNKDSVSCESNIYTSLIVRISNDVTKLDCLKREVRYKRAKYRGRDKFSHSGKPQGKTVKEKLIDSVDLNM